MKYTSRVYGNTWSLMDDAIELIRNAPLSALASYYIGTMPFIFLAVSFFFRAGTSAKAESMLPVYSLVLALSYVWMKTWHSIYSWKLTDHLNESQTLRLSAGILLRLALRQTIIQGTGILMIPLGLITTIPFGYLHAFYQTASIKDRADDQPLTDLMRESGRSASMFGKQNHFIIWMLSPCLMIFSVIFFLVIVPFVSAVAPDWSIAMTGIYAGIIALVLIPLNPLGLVVFLNIASLFLAVPALLKMLLGIETIFTQNPSGIFNTTFFALVTGLTILVMEPVMKSAYVLRNFYIDSLRTGDDIRVSLSRLSRKTAFGVILFACIQIFIVPSHAEISREHLDQAIEEELEHSRYEWVPPSLPDELRDADPVEKFFINLSATIKSWVKSVFLWLTEHLQRFLQGDDSNSSKRPSTLGQISYELRVLFVVILSVLTAMICRQVIMSVRKRRKKSNDDANPAGLDPLLPDISSETTTANDLPTDEWMSMAEDLASRGEFRFALRALYLSILAWLADTRHISLSHYKSNRDYRWELMQHAGRNTTLIDIYNRTTKLYEAVWYGSAPADPDALQVMKTGRRELVSDEN